MITTQTFEVLRFDAAPVTEDVAVVELEGRWSGPAPGRERRLRLIVEGDDAERLELTPLSTGGDADRWHASFAVPARDDATYALALRGVRLDLPVPDARDDAERLVALARELNALRRRLEAAENAAQERSADAERLVAAREAAAQQRLDDAEERVRAAEQRAGEGQETSIRLRNELEAARVAQAARETEAAAAAEVGRDLLERAQAETREQRRLLKAAKAELEAARRERLRPVPAGPASRPRGEPPTAVGPRNGDLEADRPDGEEAPGHDDAPTTAHRGGVLAPGVGEALPDPDGTAANAEGLDTVRVIGRERRRTLANTVPPTTAELDPPPAARWLALGALVAVAFVLLLVVVFSVWL
ncbi:MAG: hypothetical protein QOH43_635 [Solirubrobacteraceae bacterium]|nr:hypothetical protein [Solirubrobacteraceae bacterium]